ncbi:MAG TPA: aldo/keto reductase [Candidatus Dormibacteraeota bacterium]|nr:aldo/keto reductase [Candidatus Dormibacteraeota bacterium]
MNKDKPSRSNRRSFLKSTGVITAVAVGSVTLPKLPRTAEAKPVDQPRPEPMPTRNLGKTGYKVGIFSLGGQASIEKPHNEDIAVPIIEKALDLGVNYIDTSSIYGGPERWSEQYVGKVMKHRRSAAFLATKTKERTREGSKRMIEKSLELLQTDHIDLWQLHDIGTMHDIDEIFAKGGAMEALLEARDQKIVKYLGITGHYRPDALIEAIHRYPFDTILMAVNAADPHHFSFSEQLLPLAVERQMGIIGMKVPARGRILSSWTPPPIEQQKHSWEGMVLAPTPGTLDMRQAMYYSLSLPVSTVIIGCDSIAQLQQNVQLARDFTPLNQTQMAALTQKAEPVSKQSLFFRFYERA